jgi:valyl-tRNA synthetase
MLDKTFNPQEVESRIYNLWVQSGAFRAGRRPEADPFCIVIPPPNVTGRLHIGHALNNTLQDAVTRFQRMRGKDMLWQPGMDHAGIATQLVVERQLAAKQIKRTDMTRDDFIAKVWEWKEESGGAILDQLHRLGASADWDRARFTMDEGLSRAVLKVFVTLYNQGLIKKDKRLVNWDPRLQTAVSDLEVESIEMKGNLWYLRYPVDGTDEFITVATTRPETMLGDTAVAVHPDNEKYKHLIGKQVKLPLCGRLIPIIADEHADPEKGTGAVKITPAHDFDDFEVGKRHNLPMINILNKDGTLNDSVPEKYRGLDRFVARKQIVADFEELGLFDKIEPITHAIPHDEKTKTVVLEPYLTEQWYLNVKPLAERAIKAVEDGRTKFVPENWTNVYYNWLKNIQPWCISRQLWWGHQLPVWYVPRLDKTGMLSDKYMDEIILALEGYDSPGVDPTTVAIVAVSEEEALEKAKDIYRPLILAGALSLEIAQNHDEAEDALGAYAQGRSNTVKLWRDPDVLDTWFSSALWPFSTLGWPDQTEELKRFYPTNVLITGFDIIFFWVARMMMMGLHFMDEVPFHTVYIHNRVLDEKGVKMSKTKGNVIDPLELIDQFGADALRFTVCLAAGQTKDMRIGPSRVEVNRNFATKLWNAARFCEMNGCDTREEFDPAKVEHTVNKWIVAEVAKAAAEATDALEAYRFNDAAGAIYHFVWDIYCDWYLEFIKPLLNGTDEGAKAEARMTAAWVRDMVLKLLHPFMPYITEELWARTVEHLTPRQTLLIEAEWPELGTLPANDAARAEMNWVIELVQGVRSVRSEMNVPPAAKIALVLKDASAETKQRLDTHVSVIATLARLSTTGTSDGIPPGSAQFVIGEAVAALPLGNVIDFTKERARLEKELKKAHDEITRFEAKLGNEQFVSRAPEDVLQEQRDKLADAQALAARLKEAVTRLL